MIVIHVLDLFGVAVFAVTGALAAGGKRMDLFGTVVIAIVTALGGGTLRDVILGIKPVLWIANPLYIVIATLAALATFLVAPYMRFPMRALLIFDAFGLGMFTIIGCQRALVVGVSPVVIVTMGLITGVAGGMLRDILSGDIPLVLRSEVYATASLAGGVLFVTLRALDVGRAITVIASAALVVIIRLIAIHYKLSLPRFPGEEEGF